MLSHEGGIMDYKEELIKTLGRVNMQRDDVITEENYKLDDIKAARFIKIVNYCESLTAKNGGSIENIVTKKKSLPAEVQMRFPTDLVFGEGINSVEELSSILELCDGMTVGGTGLEDGSFLVSFFIDNLYVEK